MPSPCAPTNITLALGCCRCQGNTHFPCSEALFAARITPQRTPSTPSTPSTAPPQGADSTPSTPQGADRGPTAPHAPHAHAHARTPPRTPPRTRTPAHARPRTRTRPHPPTHAHEGTYARISGVTGIRAVPASRTRIRANRAGAPLERFEGEPRRSDLQQHKGGAMVLDDASRSTATKKRGSNKNKNPGL